jgi:hypothetical protein
MTKKEDFFVQVTLTPEQAGVVVDALDLFSRLHIGQFHTVAELFFDRLPDRETVALMENTLFDARQLAFPELTGGPNQSHSMSSRKVSEVGKVAWDVQQVIRHTTSWARNPDGGMQSSYSSPLFLSKAVPRPVGKAVSILDRLADA